jgi:peptidoglycan/LPS O-acetylase OafA/YrhL
MESLTSSIFRRFLRLYLSCGAATFISAILIHFHLSEVDAPVRRPTLPGQLWHWFRDWLITSNPFANIEGWIHPNVLYSKYLAQMWTIPIEYRGSIVLFVFCIASARLSVRSRFIFLWIVVLLCYYWRSLYVAEFLFGMFIAELSLLRNPERLSLSRPSASMPSSSAALPPPPPAEEHSEKPSTPTSSQSLLSRIGYSILLFIALYILSQPEPPTLGANGPFPFQYLRLVIPSYYGSAAYTFWLSIGAFLLVLALDSYPALQTPFRWSFSQYLGELSFGIYAMHVSLVRGLYRKGILVWQVRYLGNSAVAYIPGMLVLSLCVLWVADYFTRIDRLVVAFGRWLQSRLFEKWD